MHELVPQVLERIATRIVALGLQAQPALGTALGGGEAVFYPDWPRLDLSSEVELAELFRSVTTQGPPLLRAPGQGPPDELSSAGPARIVADVNHRLDLAVDELLRQPISPLYLPYISPISPLPLHLPYISPISGSRSPSSHASRPSGAH